MNHRRLPLGLIATGLLLVLASFGIVNGLWSKTLEINGTVTTGDVNVDWSGFSFSDELCIVGLNPLFPCDFPPKNVGQGECHIDPADHQIMVVTASNVYPSYDFDCEVEFKNTGSIPVNFTGYGIVPGSGITGCVPLVTETLTSLTLDCDQITIQFIDGSVGQQYDPGEEQGNSLKYHIKQAAAQSDCTAGFFAGIPPVILPTVLDVECDPDTLVTYGFSLKFCFAQWNEDASFEECVDSLNHEGPPNGPGDGDGIPYYLDTEGAPGNDNGVAGGDDCLDGVDNDGDGFIDAADPGCAP
jgi:hypothetical protein